MMKSPIMTSSVRYNLPSCCLERRLHHQESGQVLDLRDQCFAWAGIDSLRLQHPVDRLQHPVDPHAYPHQDIPNELPCNDYFGPNFKLHIAPSNMANQNTSEYVDKIRFVRQTDGLTDAASPRSGLLENLRMLPPRPRGPDGRYPGGQCQLG